MNILDEYHAMKGNQRGRHDNDIVAWAKRNPGSRWHKSLEWNNDDPTNMCT
jgi:hypothetical protein